MGYKVSEKWKMCRIMQKDDDIHEEVVAGGIGNLRDVNKYTGGKLENFQ